MQCTTAVLLWKRVSARRLLRSLKRGVTKWKPASVGMREASLGGAKSSKGIPKLGCCGVAPTQGQMVLYMAGEACLHLNVSLTLKVSVTGGKACIV